MQEKRFSIKSLDDIYPNDKQTRESKILKDFHDISWSIPQ